jgi:hypothetical protein
VIDGELLGDRDMIFHAEERGRFLAEAGGGEGGKVVRM